MARRKTTGPPGDGWVVRRGGVIVKKIVQIMPANGEYEAVFFSYDDGGLFTEPVLCWALISETPYAENGDESEEKRYIEGQVIFMNGCNITGVYDLPQCPGISELHGEIGFLGYLNTRLPENAKKDQMEYFKREAEGLIAMRRAGCLPAQDRI